MTRRFWTRTMIAGAAVVAAAATVMAPRALRAATTPPPKSTVMYALPNGSEETPPNNSPATAFARLILTADHKQLLYEVHVSGLSGDPTAMHLHMAPRGTPGSVIIPLAIPAGGEAVGCVDVPAGADAALLAQQMYLNIHTGKFPAGEIRGQVVPGP